MRRASVVLAPVLAAAFPVLFLYAHNVDEVAASSVIPLLLVAVAAAILLTVVLWLVFRNHTQASLIATVWVLLFLMYGHIHGGFAEFRLLGTELASHRLVLPATLAVAVVLSFAVLKKRALSTSFAPYATAILAALVLFNLVSAVIPEAQRVSKASAEPNQLQVDIPSQAGSVQLPDIYYIVPDRYPNNSTLKEYYGYDNSEFTEYLEDSGFYVADQSYSNYHHTYLSLASSLNMTYLDTLAEEIGTPTGDKSPATAMVRDYAVWRTLKEQYGYKYIHFGSWWGGTENNQYADVEISKHPRLFGLVELDNSFSRQMFTTSALWPFENQLLVRESFSHGDAEIERCQDIESEDNRHPNNEAQEQCHRALYTFEQLKEMPSVEGPKFVFVHLMVPHPPYVFGPDGEIRDPPPFWFYDKLTDDQKKILKERFIDQLMFTNKMLQESIDHILAKSPRPPIIVVQADEGPWTPEFPKQERAVRSPGASPDAMTAETLRVRHRILNAYHLPGDGEDALYPSISPVNAFRVIFNEYFGAELPLLEDRAYRSRSFDEDVYHFVDVTDRVKFDE